VKLTPAPEELEDEDLMEMANAGLVDLLVVDNHKAWFWQRVWPKLKLYPTVTLRKGGEIAWAIRKNNPQLKEALNKFLETNGADSLTARMVFRRYLLNTRFVKGAGAEVARQRFLALVALFRKYGSQYNMDWTLIQGEYLNRQNLKRTNSTGNWPNLLPVGWPRRIAPRVTFQHDDTVGSHDLHSKP
jgi:membrane-bound lytic murein transglycosylase MltF